MIGGVVYIENKVQTGEDAHGNPIYEDATPRMVENVLIAVGATSNINDSNRPNGASVAYTLYFPKTFNESLRGKRIRVGGDWFDVIGDPRPWTNPAPPTPWHMEVEVGAVYG